MLRAKKTSNTNTSFSRKLVQKITVSIEKAFTSYALCKMLLYFEHRVLNIELEREGTKKKAQNGKSKSVCPRYFARHCIPACALSSVRLRKCRVPFVDTSVFFSRISVTRLFVKYDSSFSLWRWWRRNKYRQTRIFIKLQRDTNTCKMFACRIKIPQKRQTKSEDASLEPTIVLCSTDQMDHPEFRRPRLPTLKRSRILAWNGNYKSLDLTDSREKWDTPFIGKSVKSRA